MSRSRFSRRIGDIPGARDFLDRRGLVKKDRGFLDLLRTGVPAVLAVAPAVVTPIRDLLAPWPIAAVIGKVVMPLSLFALSLNAIVSRNLAVVEESPLYVEPLPTEWVYRFTASPRILAKIAVIPLLLLGVLAIRDVIPVGWWGGPKVVAGYVCADRAAVAQSEVEIIDALGLRAGITETDDSGWFRVTLDDWARRPAYLRLAAASCAAKELVPLGGGVRVRYGCPASNDPGNYERHGDALAWRAQCR